MVGTYEVAYRGQTVGTADVIREGLYYRILARCRVSDSEIHRLYAGGEKLGVLIPDRGGLILETRIPAKRWSEVPVFSLDASRGEFIPIRQGKPFSKLNKVRMGKLAIRDGEPGLLLEV